MKTQALDFFFKYIDLNGIIWEICLSISFFIPLKTMDGLEH